MKSGVWQQRLGELRARGLVRSTRVIAGPVGPVVQTADGPKINFSSNDYLGLAGAPELTRALVAGAERWGVGAASSRLVAGHTVAHEELESALASYFETEDAVFFPTGYQANVGALVALTEAGDTIYSDELVHASLVDGCRLSRARVKIFQHRDVDHLESLIGETDGDGLKLIVTDAVFSMDGDLAPLRALMEIAARANAVCYVDEAHALGILGPGGRGLAAKLKCDPNSIIRIGTFGKSFGVAGAAVACCRDAGALIRSRARSLLYTTATPAPLAEVVRVSLSIVESAETHRARLVERIDQYTRGAGELGLPVMPSTTPIQPIVVGDAGRTTAISENLFSRGFLVHGMRPPTVAEGTSRLRVTLTAGHTREHVDKLLDALGEVFKHGEDLT